MTVHDSQPMRYLETGRRFSQWMCAEHHFMSEWIDYYEVGDLWWRHYDD